MLIFASVEQKSISHSSRKMKPQEASVGIKELGPPQLEENNLGSMRHTKLIFLRCM